MHQREVVDHVTAPPNIDRSVAVDGQREDRDQRGQQADAGDRCRAVLGCRLDSESRRASTTTSVAVRTISGASAW